MRHGKKDNHLGRTTAHRSAMLSNLAISLILHKRITTTTAKAKELRKYVEPILTRSKDDTTHSRRIVFAELQNKEAIKELYGEVAGKIAGRPGGYTRIIKLSAGRAGDNADMCVIELVDYNTTLLEAKSAGEAKATTRRSRRGGAKKEGAATTAAPAASTTQVETSAPADTATETLKEGETREGKTEESAS
ncbi:50S ribosomal protein L17 [Hymenobacter sp. 15J16-1T3B]|uniref:50S ribosomal protein L17 n=1 Tax=Hymenobacter sp. 15J16-1T3B TaxID=2886941 RepID=UPI001D0FA8FA|nr:50S ribosomal protein L17 [Hymenobacter sp. 15J16-1T3B]MCC3157717.1 50S ribosomal protein L17 [Hymenobacter sp. 15J16-1T3B]